MKARITSVIFPLPLPKEIAEYEGLISALPKARQDKISRAPEGKKQQSLAAYLCLVEACRRHTGSLFLPEYEAGGFTRLTCGLYANISHTETAVMAAVSDTPVGVDVQTVRKVTPALIKRALPERDAEGVLSSPDISRAFALAWARREALVKAHGVGLAGREVSPEGFTFEEGFFSPETAYAVCYKTE